MTTPQLENDIPVVLVLAAAQNGVIGRGNALPWDLPDDLQHFKRTTLGRPIIMGRKTFESVGFPLPGRTNIVVTRDQSWSHEGVRVCHTLDEALQSAFDQALIDGADAAMVVGGAEIYRLALPRADRVVLTRVEGDVVGDVIFDLDLLAGWQQRSSQRCEADGRNSHAFTVIELVPPANEC